MTTETQTARKHFRAGEIYRIEGLASKAIAEYRLGLEANPDEETFNDLMHMLGVALKMNRQHDEAFHHLDTLLGFDLEPLRRGRVLRDVGDVMLKRGQVGEAISTLRQSLRVLSEVKSAGHEKENEVEAEIGATAGFLSRAFSESHDREMIQTALSFALLAETLLRQSGAMDMELYHGVELARIFALAKEPDKCRERASFFLKEFIEKGRGNDTLRRKLELCLDLADQPISLRFQWREISYP